MISRDKILVLDFGSQYTQLIVRKIREFNVYAYVLPYNTPLSQIKKENPKGIIFSGGPSSVYESNAPTIEKEIFNLGIPILGICYGLQLMIHLLGGKVEKSPKREFGRASLEIKIFNPFMEGIPERINVWMSHSDKVISLADGFTRLASSDNTEFAVIYNEKLKLFGLQFHPEVYHTESGKRILENFSVGICKCDKTWEPWNFIKRIVQEIREKAEGKNFVCALSGGVDSTVAAVLVHEAIGDKLTCIHIDNGLMRKNESKEVVKFFRENLHLRVKFVDASRKFLDRLKNIVHPEEKRRIIGNAFIEVIEEEVKKIENVSYLVQGTLYPDVIESVSVKGPSAVIKTHHNVGGLPQKMNLKLIEPLRELFKDEVRIIGKQLNIPEDFLNRHPFPGPGLGVRIIDEITEERLNILRDADEIFINELRAWNLYHSVWQAFCVLLPVKSVGVMGDERTYENTIVLRAVTSTDGMTADWAQLNPEFLKQISNKIVNEVKGVNRVVYDITSKPPATIEWE